uniref:Uncharacterized protein n=1 Tax=Arundo donax TaxID=35708 RepID=A0A0A9BID5_ARUDO
MLPVSSVLNIQDIDNHSMLCLLWLQ